MSFKSLIVHNNCMSHSTFLTHRPLTLKKGPSKFTKEKHLQRRVCIKSLSSFSSGTYRSRITDENYTRQRCYTKCNCCNSAHIHFCTTERSYVNLFKFSEEFRIHVFLRGWSFHVTARMDLLREVAKKCISGGQPVVTMTSEF